MVEAFKDIEKVSVHGGHSGQFCQHARDDLEAVVRRYVDEGFSWVGITEHMPPVDDAHRYPDEEEAGLAAGEMARRFDRYFSECQRLRKAWRDEIDILVAFETEMYPGALDYVRALIARYEPDYIVGSVHHVRGRAFDFSPALYAEAVETCGGLERMYCDYFDAQLEMLDALKPAVVGHFDLVRIYDPDYADTLERPAVARRIRRNLEYIGRSEMILDLNLRGFDKSPEQYPATSILRQALDMGIAVVPGDDSHGVDSVGRHFDRGLEVLHQLGADCHWRRPGGTDA